MQMKTKSVRKPSLSQDYFKASVKAGIRKLGAAKSRKPDEETVDSLLKTLVAFPTISDDTAANRGALQYVQSYLRNLGMHTEYMEPENSGPVLWATPRAKQKHPKILLAAHIDVIPSGKEMFNLRTEGDRYYGRGVMDMKAAIAAYLKAIANLGPQMKHCDFGVLLTSDEEMGGRDGINGVRRMLQHGYGADFVILPDGGDNWSVEESSNGYMHLTIESHGKVAHSSRPWEGDNALTRLIDGLAELQSYFKDQGPDTTTMNIGAISGGEVANKIPGHASADISYRMLYKRDIVSLMKLTEKVCKKYKLHLQTRAVFDPLEHSFEDPFMKSFLDTIEEVRGVRSKGMRSYAGSDARIFKDEDIPVAVFYPNGNGHHSDHEWIERKSLHQMEQVITKYLQKYGTQQF
jgi:succinyl-diaminopimelate desuccinylase